MNREAAELAAYCGAAFGTTAMLAAAAVAGAGYAARAAWRRIRPPASPQPCTCRPQESR